MGNRPRSARFADDLTNLSTPFAAPSISSSSSGPRSKRRASYRQTSLADSFLLRPTSPAPTPSSSPLSGFAGDAHSPRPGSASSAFATSPLRPNDENTFKDSLADEPASSDGRQPGRSKRRRVTAYPTGSAEEGDRASPMDTADEWWPTAAFDIAGARNGPRLPATRALPGEQFSAFDAMRRRERGFRVQSQHPAKSGGKKVVAVADEEGTISLMDGEANQWHAGPVRRAFHAHDNAIWDVSWRNDDDVLATASGDSTVRLWDSATQTCLGVLRGHQSSVRSVSWDPFNKNLLSTASRDGTIRVWDRRVTGYAGTWPGEGEPVGMVNMIKNAHAPKGKPGKSRATTSVTGVTHLQHQEHLLASSGSSDGVVKIWDLRRSHTRRVNPATWETNEDAVTNTEAARPHGISSLVLAPDGRKLYALSTDSSIVALDPLNLTHLAPVTTFQSPLSQHGSFYIRCAVSPCSRYLASGSSSGDISVWDTAGTGAAQEAVRLRGHELETGQLDWAEDSLVSASDDALVRFWRPNMSLARLRKADRASLSDAEAVQAEQARDRWSGAVEG
ncbi:hypothetical protein JCM8202v2_003297 [Rhodotorula sphaerocarpa]